MLVRSDSEIWRWTWICRIRASPTVDGARVNTGYIANERRAALRRALSRWARGKNMASTQRSTVNYRSAGDLALFLSLSLSLSSCVSVSLATALLCARGRNVATIICLSFGHLALKCVLMRRLRRYRTAGKGHWFDYRQRLFYVTTSVNLFTRLTRRLWSQEQTLSRSLRNVCVL